jgi:hypothetical protein
MNAFRALRKEPLAESVMLATESFLAKASDDELAVLQRQRVELQGLCEKQNVSLNGFMEVARLADEITSRLNERDKGIRVDARAADDKYDAERYGELQRCILSASVNHLFQYESEGLRDLLRDYGKERSEAGQFFRGYRISNASIVPPPKEGTLMVGNLREIQLSKADAPAAFLTLTDVTVIPPDVFISWAADRAVLHQHILIDGVLSPEYTLEATYAGKARFEIEIAQRLREKAKSLIKLH